jgi:rRNA maturation endonuclease Nob1
MKNFSDKILIEIDKINKKINNGGDFKYLSAYKDGLEFAFKLYENLENKNICYRCGGNGVILKVTKKQGVQSCKCPGYKGKGIIK